MRKRTRRKSSEARGPVRIGEIVPQIMARYGFQRRHESERLHAAWDEILVEFLPASFSGSTRPGNIRRGILEVQIVHSALIQELSFSESRILEKLKEKIPELKIRKIKYVVNF